jgi:hypothetical protein
MSGSRQARRTPRRRRARRPRRVFGARRVPAWLPRAVLAAVLLIVALVPVAGTVADSQSAACRGKACGQAANPQSWVRALSGSWAVGSGITGTYPASGQAYVAVGDGLAAIGSGLTVSAYKLTNGAALWTVTLGGFKSGSAVMSMRAWRGVVTVGVSVPAAPPGTTTRTEVVIDSMTGVPLRRYPAALFGGAVSATKATVTIIGTSSVTSYDNATGKVRWQRSADSRQAWRTDGATLYITESAGGYLRGGTVTGLRVIDLASGAQRTLSSPSANRFTGSLAEAVSGVVLFSSATGVTAYSSATGGMLWTMHGVVPEGTDPGEGLAYFTSSSGTLLGVDPLTGAVRRSVSGATAPGSGGLYVVRGGVALGLDSGPAGEAWGYSLVAGRVTWTAPGLPWPHYFADVSGIGGSAAQSGDTVVIVACQRLAPAPVLQPSVPSSSPATSTPPATSVPPTSTPPATSASATSTPPATSASATSTPPASSAPASSVPATSASSATTQPSPSATSSPTPTPTATQSPTSSPLQMCAAPVLVALAV